MMILPDYIDLWNKQQLRKMLLCLGRGLLVLLLSYGFVYLALRPVLGLFLEAAFLAKWGIFALVLVFTGLSQRDFPGHLDYVPMLGERVIAQEKLDLLLGARTGGAYGFGFRRPRPHLFLLFFTEGPALILEGLSHWRRRVSLRSVLVDDADRMLASLSNLKIEEEDPRSVLLLFRLNLIWPEYNTLRNELILKPTVHGKELVT